MYVQSMYKSGTGSDAPKAVLHQKWVSLNGIAGATYIKSCQIWKFDKTLLKLPYTQIFDFSEGVVQSKNSQSWFPIQTKQKSSRVTVFFNELVNASPTLVRYKA